MPRNMSFMLTIPQIRDKTKTVTRRLGWWFLKPGDIINACEKCQGLKKGEKIKKICRIRVLHTRKVLLCNMEPLDCVKEGFPGLTEDEFVKMFMREMKCSRTEFVNRIWFEYVYPYRLAASTATCH